ncbi:hypothetical protein [Bosea beijingensis]|uniref:hypothetical protein n=1 Tax=Bosea beijingensis TaxID=3068632 RepID=UPI00274299B1|nr:hypothetical protein [Bosea sp. REN20]
MRIAGDIFVRQPKPQTLKAWEPFWDCVDILFEFQNSDIDDEHPEWRTNWIAGLALLRCVGHVLAKVDALTSSRHRTMIDAAYKAWKLPGQANDIFFGFIENERNNILKTYTIGARIEIMNGNPTLIYGDGEDALQAYRLAVYWWRHQLEQIEFQLENAR